MTTDERLDRLARQHEAHRIASEARLQSIERSLVQMVNILERRTISPVLFWGVTALLFVGEVCGWFLPIPR